LKNIGLWVYIMPIRLTTLTVNVMEHFEIISVLFVLPSTKVIISKCFKYVTLTLPSMLFAANTRSRQHYESSVIQHH